MVKRLTLRNTKRNAAFTLIELVTVIAVISIMAVVATPSFVDISDDARTGALAGIKGALVSADKVNKVTKRGLNKGADITPTDTCETAAGKLLDDGIPAGFTVGPAGAFTGSVKGDEESCTLTDSASNSVNFDVTLTSN